MTTASFSHEDNIPSHRERAWLADPRLCRGDFSDAQNYEKDLDRQVERLVSRQPRFSVVYRSEVVRIEQHPIVICERPWPPSASGPVHERREMREHSVMRSVAADVWDHKTGTFTPVGTIVAALFAAVGLGVA